METLINSLEADLR